MTPEEIHATWINGNRKDAVRELAKAERDVIFSFMMLLPDLSDRTTVMVLALGYGVEWR